MAVLSVRREQLPQKLPQSSVTRVQWERLPITIEKGAYLVRKEPFPREYLAKSVAHVRKERQVREPDRQDAEACGLDARGTRLRERAANVKCAYQGSG